jgi:hypothetical protein
MHRSWMASSFSYCLSDDGPFDADDQRDLTMNMGDCIHWTDRWISCCCSWNPELLRCSMHSCRKIVQSCATWVFSWFRIVFPRTKGTLCFKTWVTLQIQTRCCFSYQLWYRLSSRLIRCTNDYFKKTNHVTGGKILLPSKDLFHSKATWVRDTMIASHIDLVGWVPFKRGLVVHALE